MLEHCGAQRGLLSGGDAHRGDAQWRRAPGEPSLDGIDRFGHSPNTLGTHLSERTGPGEVWQLAKAGISPMTRARGVTLLELMIAVSITVTAIGATMGLVGYTGVLARHADIVAESNNSARLAGDSIAAVLRNSGMGGGQGLYLAVGGSPIMVNPIHGADNLSLNYAGRSVNSSDDLWLIGPDKNAMRDNCNSKGAYVSVIGAGLGPLSVVPFPSSPCTNPFANGDSLLVTNMNKSALITGIALNSPGPNQINYNESAISGFSNAPERGGFQVGDMALRARVVHFYLDVNPLTNRLALYQATGTIGPDFLGRPLTDVTASRAVG